MTNDSDSAISVHHLTKEFKTLKAVDDLSFAIEHGHVVGLLGPNGAGKTTTIQMLLGTITPTRGTICMLGLDFEKDQEKILSQINFSSPYVALPGNLKVWENLTIFAGLYNVKNPRRIIAELTSFFEIEDLLPKMTNTLSTGQMTRVNLTKALLNNPRILLLDEPTASLDPDIADKTRQLLKAIQKERDVTILYTSHNMDEIEEMCDRVLFINEGKLVADDSPQNLISQYGMKDLTQVFLAISRGEKKI